MDSFELDEDQKICRKLIRYFKIDYKNYLKDVVPEVFIECLKQFLKNPDSNSFMMNRPD